MTISNITMRGILNSPLFLRLGRRMRGPQGRPIGTLQRVLINNLTSSGAAQLPSIIAGLPGHPIEDVKISDVFLSQTGGAPEAMAQIQPPANETAYPEPTMFGDLPATGFFIRHAKNVEMSNVEIAVERPDPRPALWIQDTDGVDVFRLRAPEGPAFSLNRVKQFRTFGARGRADREIDDAPSETF